MVVGSEPSRIRQLYAGGVYASGHQSAASVNNSIHTRFFALGINFYISQYAQFFPFLRIFITARSNLPTCWDRFGEKKEGITHTISRSLGPRHPVTSKENTTYKYRAHFLVRCSKHCGRIPAAYTVRPSSRKGRLIDPDPSSQQKAN